MFIKRRERGLTLIELILFIVIVSVGLLGMLSALNYSTQHSADPIIRKQALAIAEAILAEVQSQPFTWCDPDDENALSATSAVLDPTKTNQQACWNALEQIGLENAGGKTEAFTPDRTLLDNVNDYHGLTTDTTIVGGSQKALYQAQVSVQNSALNGVPADASLLITVSVTAGNETLQVQGYRIRHSPNLLP